ncbi:unnamed protein product [Ceratitis capitata]|uniref:(Mediterranean fruit fly) hypothetical protein n=1 Tax=Ceratitis capitata TaxID=7213 RepID=A0A811UGP3_CERCA|nr:unnamed protein product [Ceratitis capitata]
MPKICPDCNCIPPTTAHCLQQNIRTAKDYLWEKAAHTRPAVDFMHRLVRTYCCICCNYRRKKSIGIAGSINAGESVGAAKVESGNMCETIDEIVTRKQNNNVTFDDWKQPLEAAAPQLLEYTEHLEIEQLICSGDGGNDVGVGVQQQNNSTPVLSVPGISNEEHV